MGIPNCIGTSFFDARREVDDAEAYPIGVEGASFIGSQTIKARFPCISKPADPGRHETSSVENFIRLSVAITTFPSPTAKSLLSVCPRSKTVLLRSKLGFKQVFRK
jgi:hypothetical protein